MTEYKHDYAGATSGNYQASSSAPAWTVPSDVVPRSDEQRLITNSNPNLSSQTAVPVPSAPDISEFPPNYFDISIVPNNAVLHYNEVPSYSQPSEAAIERKSSGILSLDSLIDRNPDQLWLYFMTYLNEKPTLIVRIHGHHTEHYTTYERRQAPDGSWHTQPVHRTRSVTDFNFSFDVSSYVSQQWWRVAVLPSSKKIKAGEYVSLRDAVEQYTRSEKNIKQITCQKQILGWNFEELTNKIRAIIYSTGYRSQIDVIFTITNDRITARSSSKLSRFANSTVVQVLCVLTCLFLIFGPIYLCLRSAGSVKDQIIADYTMVAPVDTFLHCNGATIANAAIGRSAGTYIANLA